ncbi:MAG: DUF86 domain-containing protein [Patescibacteria group bacterium]|nr:DUF86 domain-containing protein [Patescibacteria group bacterium]
MNTIHEDVVKKITLLQGYLKVVSDYAATPTEELLKNIEKLSTMERYFILMADEAFDINSAIAYQLGNKIPDSNRSTFYEVATLGIITSDFAEKISLSAWTRNNLVHDYEHIQKSQIVADMKKYTELYKEYTKILIEKFVAKKDLS